ncbi:nuclease-related domain-containing protein [Carbonactinospora thermoautotrophica]|uniref:nuclease-related domain-containing protein n=1 Tax=Carbonactinospora thermoautotrophica TaxID=1469144 RepID=UPI00226E0516|nr:nuclease-related domain-containing protein [Carbonactinospora thermoautotrophica]
MELKWYSGTLRGDDHRWLRDGHRAEDSPLKLARRKAQRLAAKLRDEPLTWAREHNHRIPDPRQVIPLTLAGPFGDRQGTVPAAAWFPFSSGVSFRGGGR